MARAKPVDPALGPLAEFARDLRQLRAANEEGAASIDQISSTEKIPRSTLYTALKGDRLPSPQVVSALVRAWGGNEAEWIARRSALADAIAGSGSRRPSQSLRDGSVWRTVPVTRMVLAVVGNITSLARMLDVVSLFSVDSRIQVVFTMEEGSDFGGRLSSALDSLGAITIPWHQAVAQGFDLVLTTNATSQLAEIDGPLIVMPHPLSYPYPPEPDRTLQSSEQRSVFGLWRDWVAEDAALLPVRIGVRDDAALERLGAIAPRAIESAVVVGDPTLDRMVASMSSRDHYRGVLGLDESCRLVVVTSTWGQQSLLGRHPRLVDTLLAQLPAKEFRVALVVHPNVWGAHGWWQLRQWLRGAFDSGLVLVPPLAGEQATLVAADWVIGDHGSMTAYGAALGHPVLAIDGVSPAGVSASRFDLDGDVRTQLELAARPVERESSASSEAPAVEAEPSRVLDRILYRLLRLEEPAELPEIAPVDDPAPIYGRASRIGIRGGGMRPD
ncbi:hypothetical protein [Amycolatopsis sp. GA6-003]|uniref:hypothetical protein n=1 Tax=Amycolatopsis sp. GA6-003 TaxID=2652444 RepID=UPI003917517F